MLWAELREALAYGAIGLLSTLGVAAFAGGLCAGLYFAMTAIRGWTAW